MKISKHLLGLIEKSPGLLITILDLGGEPDGTTATLSLSENRGNEVMLETHQTKRYLQEQGVIREVEEKIADLQLGDDVLFSLKVHILQAIGAWAEHARPSGIATSSNWGRFDFDAVHVESAGKFSDNALLDAYNASEFV